MLPLLYFLLHRVDPCSPEAEGGHFIGCKRFKSKHANLITVMTNCGVSHSNVKAESGQVPLLHQVINDKGRKRTALSFPGHGVLLQVQLE